MSIQTNVLSFADAGDALLQGKIGIMPTDTVYGIVAAAHNEAAVTRLYAAKHREHKPGTVIAASVSQLRNLGIEQSAIDTVAKWWPASLTAILPLTTRPYLHQGKDSLAVRVIADEHLRQLLERTGPLLTSSANLPRQPEATTIEEARAYFGDTVDFYVDGGSYTGRQPSTIIRPTDDGIEIVRQGSVHL